MIRPSFLWGLFLFGGSIIDYGCQSWGRRIGGHKLEFQVWVGEVVWAKLKRTTAPYLTSNFRGGDSNSQLQSCDGPFLGDSYWESNSVEEILFQNTRGIIIFDLKVRSRYPFQVYLGKLAWSSCLLWRLQLVPKVSMRACILLTCKAPIQNMWLNICIVSLGLLIIKMIGFFYEMNHIWLNCSKISLVLHSKIELPRKGTGCLQPLSSIISPPTEQHLCLGLNKRCHKFAPSYSIAIEEIYGARWR